MTRQHFLFLLLLPLLLWSCGAADTGVDTPEGEAVPVRFSTYIAQSATTRAATQPLSNITDIASLRAVGFGVFGYYDDNKTYSSTDDTPNFMYNQQVVWSTGDKAWTYSPLKYWPNETGTGESDGRTDHLSFFAYAPYLKGDPRLNFSANNAKGDPTVTYTTPNDLGQCLDVLYATKPDGTSPYTDLTKQNVGDSVTFSFHHTMSRLNFNVRAAFDEIAAGSNAKADSTRITVESITLETEGSVATEPLFFTSGTLNLRTGVWTKAPNSSDGTPKIVLSGNAIGTDVRDQGDKRVYQMLDANKKVIPGVDNTWRNAGNGYLTLLPNSSLTTAAPKLKVTIVYYTTSDDPRLVLSGGRTRVKSTVSKTLRGFIFERGKAYTINMLIGMTSVKFTVQVQNWRDPITFAPIVDDWGDDGINIDFDKIDP
ncbi:MAG: fimbrillin family protein [Prevotella sp.]|nr:fimbrillin family protein [Prevotella sp.]